MIGDTCNKAAMELIGELPADILSEEVFDLIYGLVEEKPGAMKLSESMNMFLLGYAVCRNKMNKN